MKSLRQETIEVLEACLCNLPIGNLDLRRRIVRCRDLVTDMRSTAQNATGVSWVTMVPDAPPADAPSSEPPHGPPK